MNFWFPYPNTLDLDLDGDSLTDFWINNVGWGQGFGYTFSEHNINSSGQNHVIYDSLTWKPMLFHAGDTIHDPGNISIGYERFAGFDNIYYHQYHGWPVNQDSLYMGLRFNTPQGWQLAWLEVRVDLYEAWDTTMMDTLQVSFTSRVKGWGYGYTYLGMEEGNDGEGLQVFPQPASDHVNLRLDNPEVASTWKVVDLTGRTCAAGAFHHSAVIQTGGLARGPYLLCVETKRGILRKKIMLE